jgi:LmbE family N-acetylglucosaminyl deacetylase
LRHYALNNARSLLAIFAHPDDETFRPGGTLALLARQGVRVQVLTATHGGVGSCGAPPLCTPEELPVVRERELCCACVALGIERPILLDYQDGCLTDADHETIVAEILSVVADVRPQVMLTFGPDGLSGHPDHIAIGQFAAEAYRRTGDVSALYTLAVPQSLADALGMSQIHALPDEVITLAVEVSETWEAKMKAIQCHATQLSSSPITSASLQRKRLFLGTEYFVLAASRGEGDFLIELEKV